MGLLRSLCAFKTQDLQIKFIVFFILTFAFEPPTIIILLSSTHESPYFVISPIPLLHSV